MHLGLDHVPGPITQQGNEIEKGKQLGKIHIIMLFDVLVLGYVSHF
jgi:hypothetical protein